MIYTDGTHLISSESLDELHSFAINKLKFKKSWFQWHTRYPHYDLTTASAKRRAINEGAILIDGFQLLKILKEVNYMKEFFILAIQEYENDLNKWLKMNFPENKIEDIQKSNIHGCFHINNQDVNVMGLFMNRYYKENGFWKTYHETTVKRKLLKEMD